jgi:hypothetical protein
MEPTVTRKPSFYYFHELAELGWTHAQYPPEDREAVDCRRSIDAIRAGKRRWTFRDPKNPAVVVRVLCKPQSSR